MKSVALMFVIMMAILPSDSPRRIKEAIEPPPIPTKVWEDIKRVVIKCPVYDHDEKLYLRPLYIQHTRFNEPDRPPYSLIVNFIYLYPDGRVGAALSLFCPCGRDRYLFEVARLTPHKVSFIFPDKTYTFGRAEEEGKVYDGYVAHEVKARFPIPEVGRISLKSPKVKPPQGHARIMRRMEEAGCGEPGMGEWCYPVPVYSKSIGGRPYSVWFWHLRRIADDPNISMVVEEDGKGYIVHVGRHLCGPLQVRVGDGRLFEMGPNICGRWNRSAQGYVRFRLPNRTGKAASMKVKPEATSVHGLAVEVGDEVFWGEEPHYPDLSQLLRYGFKGILFGVGGRYHRGLHRYLMEAKRRGFWVALASRPQFIERHFKTGYGDVVDFIFVDEADAIMPNWKDPDFWRKLRKRYERETWLTLSGRTMPKDVPDLPIDGLLVTCYGPDYRTRIDQLVEWGRKHRKPIGIWINVADQRTWTYALENAGSVYRYARSKGVALINWWAHIQVRAHRYSCIKARWESVLALIKEIEARAAKRRNTSAHPSAREIQR